MQPTTVHKPIPDSRPASKPDDLAAIRLLVADDLKAVDALIHKRLKSDVLLIDQLSHYIINSGGKRLRPLLVLLCSRALGYYGSQHIDIAAIIEFIHTATLLHDDVVDGSEVRRGRDTANSVWGNEASVLVGDFLYSRAFEMMVDVREMRVMEILAHATNIIAEGEVLQLLNCNDADTTEARYLQVIHCKTAKLFESAAQLGGILSGCTPDQEQALARFGIHLGAAYQLIDDVLDYSANADEIGKNLGDDLAEGKPTLPLIYAIRTGSAKQARQIRAAIEAGNRGAIDTVMAAIESTGGIAYTADAARVEAQKANEALADVPESPYKGALLALVDFCINRSY